MYKIVKNDPYMHAECVCAHIKLYKLYYKYFHGTWLRCMVPLPQITPLSALW